VRRSMRNIAVAALLGTLAIATGTIATGRFALVVTHGISMEPTYHKGDLVVVAKSASYRPGQIAAYRGTAPDLTVLHRITGGDATGFVFKGDNNESTDIAKPTSGELIGRAVVHIPQGGLWLNRVTSPPALALIAFSLLAGGGTVIRTRHPVLHRRRRGKKTTVPRDAAPARRGFPPASTLSPQLRTTAAAIAAGGVIAAALAALAWTKPVEQFVATQQRTAPSMTFAYSAAVPRSPAYDDTVVNSPDPVFRNLAHTVKVRFAYDGTPGSVAVTAQLSTANGWHTTVPLAAATTFTSGRYDGAVQLDLDALDARASAAAAVIGIPAGAVGVTVVPAVTTTDGATFAPALRLRLAPLQLTLTGAPGTMTIKGATPAPPRRTRVPATLGLPGHAIMTVAIARALSAGLALGVLLAAVALMLAARPSVPASEGASIRRRYRSRLIQVEPMPTPPGRPVVTVTDFTTLARLADRNALLILHWSRNNADTFVLQDDGTTYLYRCDVTDSPNPLDPQEDATAMATA
jgi:signal peptidase I